VRKQAVNVFSLAFLDVMSCGFGAIILLFVIINADTVKRKEKLSENLQGEVEKLDTEVTAGRKYLVDLKNSVKAAQEIVDQTSGLSKRVIEQLEQKKQELAEAQNDTLAKTAHINKLKAELKSLEEANKRLEGGASDAESQGDSLIHIAGEGQRQYITGLTIGGEYLVILVDSSASMLADRIVNVIRNRVMPDQNKIRTAKWQQVVRTVEWISSRIPRDSKFKMVTFNERVNSLNPDTNEQWLDGDNPVHLRAAINNMRATIPGKGTSLYHAFQYISQLEPKPDSIYLLTDGLPTQGKSKPFGNTVNARQRLNYFNDAVKQLPHSVAVNVVLFPIEGDPDAASAYWSLASRSNGVFFSPANDWP
tara:strand:+ start:269 stop:1360 length:1092 start_codon:yes stop_codon:yes gene_type:complete